VAAPILLVVVRLAQGFSAGGEIIGAVTYVAESAPPRRRGFFAILTPAGSASGQGLAAVTAGAIALSTTAGQLSEWGWRIPFLLCLPLTILTLWVRMKLEDSPEFRTMVAKSEITTVPIVTAVRGHSANIARVALISLAVNVVVAVGSVYMVVHLVSDLGMPKAHALLATGSMWAVSIVAMSVTGRLSDRFGKLRVLGLGLVVSLVVSVPVFWIIGTKPSLFVVMLAIAVWQVAVGLQAPPMYGIFAELFPRNVRYSAAAFGYNIGVVFGAGLTPYASKLLTEVSGNSFAPAYLVVIASVIGLVVLVTSRHKIKDYLTESEEHAAFRAPAA
jgi:MHS family proline/betaine transporter-like MFS transporter